MGRFIYMDILGKRASPREGRDEKDGGEAEKGGKRERGRQDR